MTKHVSKFSVWRGVWLTGLGLSLFPVARESTFQNPLPNRLKKRAQSNRRKPGNPVIQASSRTGAMGKRHRTRRTVGQTRGG